LARVNFRRKHIHGLRFGYRLEHRAADKIPMGLKKKRDIRAFGCQPIARLVAAIVIFARDHWRVVRAACGRLVPFVVMAGNGMMAVFVPMMLIAGRRCGAALVAARRAGPCREGMVTAAEDAVHQHVQSGHNNDDTMHYDFQRKSEYRTG
jgi:hypothetical protein